MAAKTYAILVSPVHVVQIHADSLEEQGGHLVLKRADQVVSRFTSWMGWIEEEAERPKPTVVTPLFPVDPPPTPAAA